MKEKKPSGRPKLDDAKLTEQQLLFCRLMGGGIKRSVVIKECDISSHQYREWQKVPKMKEIIERYEQERRMKGTELFIQKYWEAGVKTLDEYIYEIQRKKEKKVDISYLQLLIKVIEGHKEGIERTGKVIYEQTRELTAKETKTITNGKGDIEAGIKQLEDSKEVEEEETE